MKKRKKAPPPPKDKERRPLTTDDQVDERKIEEKYLDQMTPRKNPQGTD